MSRPPTTPPSRPSGPAHLGLGQAQAAGQLLPLGADHVVVLLEGPLQPQQLRGREGGADPFGLPGEGSVEQQALRTAVLTWPAGGDTHRSVTSFRFFFFTK